jgi:hypothetical protein
MTLSVKLTVRMTKDAKASLDKKASKLKVNPSEFVRFATDNYDPQALPVQQPRVDWDTYHLLGQLKFELNKIGTNINQLAHDANLSLLMGSPMQPQLNELTDLSNRINQAIGLIFDVRSQITETAGLTYKAEKEDDWEN